MGKKITFTEDHIVPDEEAKSYKEGKTYPVEDATARHFIRRGMAFDQENADAAATKEKVKAENAEDDVKGKAKAEKSEAKKAEDEAKAKLKSAVKLLKEILRTYPKSQAAKQASKMLREVLDH